MKLLYWVCVGLLLVALGSWPIGYYTFLRIGVCIGGVLAAREIYSATNRLNIFVLIFIGIAILFNPLVPVYLHNKGIWLPLDLLAAACFAAKAYLTEDKK